MRITAEKVKEFHCPRWKELPGIPLYMDQVILVLEESLSIFAEDDGHVVTPTMINNYVKQKVITSPGGKRYARDQVATLIVICLLKRVLSINEITGFIGLFTETFPLSDAYDLFCAELENAMSKTFLGVGSQKEPCGLDSNAATAGRAAISALAGKLLAQGLINEWLEQDTLKKEKPVKEKKNEGKK